MHKQNHTLMILNIFRYWKYGVFILIRTSLCGQASDAEYHETQKITTTEGWAIKKTKTTDYVRSDLEYPFGFSFGFLSGYPTQANKSTFSGATGASLLLEYQIPRSNFIATMEGVAATTSSFTTDIVYMDGNNPVNTEMTILNNSNMLRFGLTYKLLNSKMFSPLIFANAGRMGSRTLLTIERPNPREDESRQYINGADIHKDQTLGFGFGVGGRFEFSRLYALRAEPIGFLDLRIGIWNTGQIEYMNANAKIKANIESGSPDQFAEILASNYQYNGDYYSDYIYKTPMDMLYFTIALGLRFGTKKTKLK